MPHSTQDPKSGAFLYRMKGAKPYSASAFVATQMNDQVLWTLLYVAQFATAMPRYLNHAAIYVCSTKSTGTSTSKVYKLLIDLALVSCFDL